MSRKQGKCIKPDDLTWHQNEGKLLDKLSVTIEFLAILLKYGVITNAQRDEIRVGSYLRDFYNYS